MHHVIVLLALLLQVFCVEVKNDAIKGADVYTCLATHVFRFREFLRLPPKPNLKAPLQRVTYCCYAYFVIFPAAVS